MREIINRYKKEVIMGVVVSLITTVVIKVWNWVILVAPTTGKNLIHTIDNLTYAIAATQSSSSLLIMLIGCIMGAIAFPVVFAVFVSMRSFINATISVKKNGQTKTGDSYDDAKFHIVQFDLFHLKTIFNIKANAISEYKDVLSGYKVTPKGMLQIFLKQELPIDVLKQIFAKTLG